MKQIYYISLNINVLCYFKDLCLQVVVEEKDWFISVEKLFDVLVTAEIFLCTLHPAKTNIYVSSEYTSVAWLTRSLYYKAVASSR